MENRSKSGIDRRKFLSVGAASALVRTIGGEAWCCAAADDAEGRRRRRRIRRLVAKAAQAAQASQQFPTPQPAPAAGCASTGSRPAA